jgi:outer membrane protein assembly factor BamB
MWGPSYASPVPAVVHGQRRVFVFAGGESDPPTGGLMSINPANGKVDFSFPWRSRSYESVNASCPVVFDNKVFISASYRTGGALLQINPDFSHKVLWTTQEFGLHFNTPIYRDGYLYGFDGRNEPDASLACVDVATGKVVWREVPEWNETVGGRQATVGTYRGALLAVDGSYLCLGELGHLLWMDLSPKGYKEVSRAWLFQARESWALPVLSRGLLYVVQNTREITRANGPRLLCYDLRA